MPTTSATSREARRQPLIADAAILSDEVVVLSSKRGASLGSVMFVLLNTILGAGILGIPFAYRHSGWAGGSALLLITGGLSSFGAHLLVEVADRTGRPATFYSVAQAAGGPKAGILIDVLIAINAYGSACSYLIVVGGVVPDVAQSFGASGLLASRSLWMLLSLIVGAPLSYLRDISALRFAAYVTFLMTVYITVAVVLFAVLPGTFEPCADQANHSATAPLDCRGEVVPLAEPMSALSVLPIFIFAFTCHQNALSATNELERPTRSRALAAILGAVGLGLGLYLMVGAGGYFTYGDKVASDVLGGADGLSYPKDALLARVGRIAMAFVVTMCYPMQVCRAMRHVLSTPLVLSDAAQYYRHVKTSAGMAGVD